MRKVPLAESLKIIGRGSLNWIAERPIVVSFEVTDACTCYCKHCDHGGPKDESRNLKPADYRRYMKALRPCVVQVSGGEPLMRDDGPVEGPEEGAARRESMELLERAIDRLPESYRVVFMLREVEQLSTADTAQALGTSDENVKVRLHRARLALREALSGYFTELARSKELEDR